MWVFLVFLLFACGSDDSLNTDDFFGTWESSCEREGYKSKYYTMSFDGSVYVRKDLYYNGRYCLNLLYTSEEKGSYSLGSTLSSGVELNLQAESYTWQSEGLVGSLYLQALSKDLGCEGEFLPGQVENMLEDSSCGRTVSFQLSDIIGEEMFLGILPKNEELGYSEEKRPTSLDLDRPLRRILN